MQKHELEVLTQRVTQIAEALGGKAPTPNAMLVWLDALAECTWPDVQNALTDWPKTHTKPPAPAEILKVSRDRAALRDEREARAQRVGSGEVWAPENVRGDPNSAAYRKFCLDQAQLAKTPKPHPRAWATRLRDSATPLEPCQVQALKDYARRHDFVPVNATADREASAEAKAERAAIQAESAPY